jgi:hypothetical protein
MSDYAAEPAPGDRAIGLPRADHEPWLSSRSPTSWPIEASFRPVGAPRSLRGPSDVGRRPASRAPVPGALHGASGWSIVKPERSTAPRWP